MSLTHLYILTAHVGDGTSKCLYVGVAAEIAEQVLQDTSPHGIQKVTLDHYRIQALVVDFFHRSWVPRVVEGKWQWIARPSLTPEVRPWTRGPSRDIGKVDTLGVVFRAHPQA